jgi:inositol oxygenase
MKKLRTYNTNTREYFLYKEMHEKQTLEFVEGKLKQYNKLDNEIMDIKTVLSLMDNFIDPSDPDLDEPNSVHAYQTAERIRKKYPNNYALQVTGLIHDLGKILFRFNEPPWAVVGDTYVVGCKHAKSIVYYDTLPKDKYSKIGIYKENIGISNLKLSFGHDEYLYSVLKNNKTHKLPEKYWNIIRFHSFYPWHEGKDYKHFMNKTDINLMEDVLHFNQFDLYSKTDTDFKLTDNIKTYYDDLLHDFFPEKLKW